MKLYSAIADLSDKTGIQDIVKSVPRTDILINNLGIHEQKYFESLTDEDWLKIFEINVLSGVRLSQYYLSQMRKSNWGRIVFISSHRAINVSVGLIHYAATKAAQLAIARGLAEVTAGTGITVNSLLLGSIRTESVDASLEQLVKKTGKSAEELEKAYINTTNPIPLIRRLVTATEVATQVVFVCSPLASAVTGAAINIDGGVISSIT